MVFVKHDMMNINDNIDILIEIMKRLDDQSLGVASSVCKLWCSITRNDSLWEHLCFNHHYPSLSTSPPPQLRQALKPLVNSLGGYRRLYMLCVRPLLLTHRRRRSRLLYHHHDRVWWTRQELELSLSLFCVDYYEKMFVGGGDGGGGGGGGGGATGERAVVPSSLMFLCCKAGVDA